MQRALVWEATEPDVTTSNLFFGFPFADAVDTGMTIQVLSNGNPELAAKIGRDMAQTAWRYREALLNSTKVHTIPEGVALAKQAIRGRQNSRSCWPIPQRRPLGLHATWLLREIVAQDLSNTLIATIADAKATAELRACGVKAGRRL